MSKEHKYQHVIDAYNRGEACQYYDENFDRWVDLDKSPGWYPNLEFEYRIKPNQEPAVPVKTFSAPVVIDTTAGMSSNLVDVTVNGVQIEGVVRAEWNFEPEKPHELVLRIWGAKTKGGSE